MPLTRAILDPILVSLVGETLKKVSRDGATVDGTNADVSIGIAMALFGMGLTAANPLAVTDDELAAVAASDLNRIIQVGRVEILDNVLSNWAKTNATAGTDNKQDWATLRNSIEISAARLRRQVEDQFGVGAGPIPLISTPSGPFAAGQNRLDGWAYDDDLSGW